MKSNENRTLTTILFKWGGIPLPLGLAHTILYLINPNSVWWDYYKGDRWPEIGISIVSGIIMYAIIFGIINYSSNWIDRNSVFKNNIMVHFLVTTVFVVVSMFLLIIMEDRFYDWFCTDNTLPTKEWEQAFRNYLIVNMIVAAFVNSFYNSYVFFERWKAEAVASHKLTLIAHGLKENTLQAELEVLKLQLDPHFMFNNFSILTQLIQTSSEDALLFLANLSRVYRYILTCAKKDMTTLDEELKFVLTYFHLIKIRKGETINLVVNLTEEDKKKGIPPVTLQLLIENAIQHNISTARQPLNIYIESAGEDFIIVKNNLQRINIDYKGTGLGLKNIAERYQLLCGIKPGITESRNEFVVRLPLLNY